MGPLIYHWDGLVVLLESPCAAIGLTTQQLPLLAISSLAWVWTCFHCTAPRTNAFFIHAVFFAAMSTPWLTSETLIAWIFRLGSAQTVESWWLLLGYPIERTGTLLSIHNQHVDVTAACSGMELLGTLVVGGSLILAHFTHSWKQLTRNLVLIILVAWLSNTLRLAVLTYAVDTWSIKTIDGMGHDSIGYIALLCSLAVIGALSRSVHGAQRAMVYLLWIALAVGPVVSWIQTTLVTPQAHIWSVPLIIAVTVLAIISVVRNTEGQPLSAAMVVVLLMLSWFSDLAMLGQIAILSAICSIQFRWPLKLGASLMLASQISLLRNIEQGTWFMEGALLITGALFFMMAFIKRPFMNVESALLQRIQTRQYDMLPVALGICILLFGQSNLLKNISSFDPQSSTSMMIPLKGFGFYGEDIPLDKREQTFYRNNKVIKRWYQADNIGFLLINIDGTTDQDALHDPAFCLEAAGWKVAEEKRITLPGGTATQVIAHRGQEQRQITWWFNDGTQRHSSLMSLQVQALAYRFGLRDSIRPSLTIIQDPPHGSNDIEDILYQIPALTSL